MASKFGGIPVEEPVQAEAPSKFGGVAVSGPTPASLSVPKQRTVMDSVKNAGSKFWEWTRPFTDAIGLAGGTDSERGTKAREAQDAIIQGMVHEPGRIKDQINNALDAVTAALSNAGHVPKEMTASEARAALHHTLRAVPFTGDPTAQIAEEANKGEYSSAIGHTGALLAPALAHELPKVGPAVAKGAKAYGEAVKDIAGSVVPEGVKSAAQSVKTAASALSGSEAAGLAADAVGMVSPRVAHGVSFARRSAKLADRVRDAFGKTEEVVPPGAEGLDPVLLDGIAKGFGAKKFAKLAAEDQAKVVELAQRISGQAPTVRPAMGPPEAAPKLPPEVPPTDLGGGGAPAPAAVPPPAAPPGAPGLEAVPPAENLTLAEMIRREYAPKEERAPVATPLSRTGEAQDVLQRPAGTNSPLRPPLKPVAAPEAMAAPPEPNPPPPQIPEPRLISMIDRGREQAGISARGPLRPPVTQSAPVVPPEVVPPGPPQVAPIPQEPVAIPAPAPPPVETAADLATPRPMSNAQAEAAMLSSARRTPPVVEEPRSMVTATGERKSPQLRAAEITEGNAKAKGVRQAQALFDAGIASDDIRKIAPGRVSLEQISAGAAPRWDNVIDDLVAKGKLPEGERPPSRSIPHLIAELKRLEKSSPAPVAEAVATPVASATPEPAPSATGPMARPEARAAAQALAEEMRRNNTPGAVESPKFNTPEPAVTESGTLNREQQTARPEVPGGPGGGLPETPEGTPVKSAAKRPEANPALQTVANDYVAQRKLPSVDHSQYHPLDENFGRRVADAYEALKDDNSADPRVRKAYEALVKETKEQYQHLVEKGYTLEPWDKPGQPYANSHEMAADLKNNKHLYFFTGGEEHPFLSAIDPDSGLSMNDMFRAIHDAYGHAAGGYGFGPRGEEAAFNIHSQSFSPEARQAMATETRGQNSWVNFGKHNYDAEGNPLHVAAGEKPYAAQKVDLLPEEFQQRAGQAVPAQAKAEPRFAELPEQTQRDVAESVLKSHGITDASDADIAQTVKDLTAVDAEHPNRPTRQNLYNVSADESGVSAYDEHLKAAEKPATTQKGVLQRLEAAGEESTEWLRKEGLLGSGKTLSANRLLDPEVLYHFSRSIAGDVAYGLRTVAEAAEHIVKLIKEQHGVDVPERTVQKQIKEVLADYTQKLPEKEGIQKSPLEQAIKQEGGVGERESALDRLRRAAEREDSVGAPPNKRTVLKDENGQIAVGNIKPQDWMDRVKDNLTPEELAKSRAWYSNLQGFFEQHFGKESAPRMALAWLLANQNESPSGAMRNVLRVQDQIAGRPKLYKAAGLAENKVTSALKGEPVTSEFGAKLSDFVDSAMGKGERTWMGNDPRGGGPAVVDVWTNRDAGHVDQAMFNSLKERFGEKAVKDLQVSKQIGETQYEYGSRFINKLVRDLNSKDFDGGKWRPEEAQAVGWVAMQKALGKLPEFPEDIISKNSKRVSFGLDLPEGAPLRKANGVSTIPPEHADWMLQQAADRFGVKIMRQEHGTGAYQASTEPSTHMQVLGSPEAVQDYMDAIGYAGQQNEVIATRPLKSGKAYSLDVIQTAGTDLASDANRIKFYNALKAAGAPAEMVEGFQPIVVDGKPGLRFLKFNGTFKPADIQKFETALKSVQGFDATVETSHGPVDLLSAGNDWSKNDAGQGYLERLKGRGRGPDAEWLDSELRPSFESRVRGAQEGNRGGAEARPEGGPSASGRSAEKPSSVKQVPKPGPRITPQTLKKMTPAQAKAALDLPPSTTPAELMRAISNQFASRAQ